MCFFDSLIKTIDNLKNHLLNISNDEIIDNLDKIHNLEIRIDDLNLELIKFKNKLNNSKNTGQQFDLCLNLDNLKFKNYSISKSSEENLNNLSIDQNSNNLSIDQNSNNLSIGQNSNNSSLDQNTESIIIFSEENLSELKEQSIISTIISDDHDKLIIDEDYNNSTQPDDNLNLPNNLNQFNNSNQSNNLNQSSDNPNQPYDNLKQTNDNSNQLNDNLNKSNDNSNQSESLNQPINDLNQSKSSNQLINDSNQSDNSNQTDNDKSINLDKSPNKESDNETFNLFGNLSPLSSSSDETDQLEKDELFFSSLEDFFGSQTHNKSKIFNLDCQNDNEQFNNESNNQQFNDKQIHDEPINDEPINDEPINDEPINDEPINDEPINDEPINDEQFKLNKFKNFEIKLPRLPKRLVNLANGGNLNMNNLILKEFLQNDVNYKKVNGSDSDDDEIIIKKDKNKRRYIEIYTSGSSDEEQDNLIKKNQSNNQNYNSINNLTKSEHQSRFNEFFSPNDIKNKRNKNQSKLKKFKNYTKINYHKFLDNRKVKSILNSKW